MWNNNIYSKFRFVADVPSNFGVESDHTCIRTPIPIQENQKENNLLLPHWQTGEDCEE